MSNNADVSREKLVSDFKVVLSDAEELLKLTAGQAGDRLSEVRGRLGDRVVAAKDRISDMEAAAVEQARKVANATDDYVHKNPWQSVGIAAGVAFLLGLLSGRR
ncbi:DUF883 family protein [Aromatoleum toluclasticum]|uniref:DUF883 family protein n=1 Tax=Aromatoleum toluclasticum TaxID=92003 RepID=UPI00036A5522|nr:DUF883 family protein [Aromatoleum toluclasticum]MCC4114067.1 DUF883 family protein [Aromatoleum toluclasticum]